MRKFKDHVVSQLPQLDTSLAAELAQDLEDRYHALIRNGSTEAEAWGEANAQMQWPRLSQELTIPRNRSPLFHLLPDLRSARRQLTHNPGVAATAILTLALAIGASTAIFSVFDALVLHPLPYSRPDQLVSITENITKFDITGLQLAALELDDVRSMTTSFSHVAGIASGEFTITGGGTAEAVSGLRVSASVFPMLDVKPLLGAPFRAEEEEYGNHRVVVISEGLWQRRFGANPNIVGTSIEINREPYRVAAVSRPVLDYLGTSWDLWVPLSFQPTEKSPASRGAKGIDVIARLKSGVTVAQASQELAAVTSRLTALYPGPYANSLGFSLHAAPLASTIADTLHQPLLNLLMAVGVLMLIACANISNLLIARGSARRTEMSIRAALGAGQWRLRSQLMIESMVIAGVSGALGLALGDILLRLFELYQPSGLLPVARVGINLRVVAFAIAVSATASILFGLIPAFSTSGLNDALKQFGRGVVIGRRPFRESVVVFEVAASLVLLICAGLLIRSFVRVQQAGPGFAARNVLTFQVLLPTSFYSEPGRRVAFYQEFASRVRALPGVLSVGAADRIPFGGNEGGSALHVAGRPVDPSAPQQMVRPSRVLPGYFESLRIPLLRGRYFRSSDSENNTPVAVIDQATALRFFPNGEDPLGRQIIDVEPGLTATIVGVVGSVKRRDLSAAPEMSVYHSATQKAGPRMTFIVKTTEDPLSMVPAIRHELSQLDPLLPLTRTISMEQRISNSLARRRLSMQLMMFFGLAALLLAAIGLYGVLSYVVQQRRREVGIRIALGANPGKVVGMIAKQGLWPVALGMAAGLAAAIAVSRLLTTILFEISSSDPLVYGSVIGLLVLTALAAIAVPARRAATVDPLTALRDE